MKRLIFILFTIQSVYSIGQDSTFIYFITADYCGFCSKMKQQLFTEDFIQTLHAENISFKELNINTKDPILFMDSTYYYEPTGIDQGQNTFYTTLFEGKSPMIPYTVIVKGEKFNGIAGYVGKEEFQLTLEHLLKD